MTLKHGVNANLLRKWAVNYQMEGAADAAHAAAADTAG